MLPCVSFTRSSSAPTPPAFSSSRVEGCPSSAALSMAKANWVYMGDSAHKVPSLSNTAIRPISGTNSPDPGSVTAATKSTMDCLVGVSRQLGSASAIPVIVVLPQALCARMSNGREIGCGERPPIRVTQPNRT